MILRNTNYRIFTHDTKLQIPSEKNYYYPDLFISTEEISSTKFIYYSAILVAEILTHETRVFDAFNKFLQYKKIPELRYYILIEPVKKVITLFFRNDKGEWQTEIFNGLEEIINLPVIKVSFMLKNLYE